MGRGKLKHIVYLEDRLSFHFDLCRSMEDDVHPLATLQINHSTVASQKPKLTLQWRFLGPLEVKGQGTNVAGWANFFLGWSPEESALCVKIRVHSWVWCYYLLSVLYNIGPTAPVVSFPDAMQKGIIIFKISTTSTEPEKSEIEQINREWCHLKVPYLIFKISRERPPLTSQGIRLNPVWTHKSDKSPQPVLMRAPPEIFAKI